MDEATGEAEGTGLRVAFDRRLKLEFHGATVTSDAGLLAFRELDDALGLAALAAEVLTDPRTGRNGRHSFIAQLLAFKATRAVSKPTDGDGRRPSMAQDADRQQRAFLVVVPFTVATLLAQRVASNAIRDGLLLSWFPVTALPYFI